MAKHAVFWSSTGNRPRKVEILESNGGKTVKQVMCKCGVLMTYFERFAIHPTWKVFPTNTDGFWHCYNDACKTTNIFDADFDSKEVRND